MEPKAVPAAGAGVERRRVARDLDAIAPRLGAKHIDRRAVIGGKMHAQQRGLRPLPDCQHVMLAAGGADVDAVALGANRFEGPQLGVELRRLMKIANAQLDTADAGNPAVRHGRDLLPSSGPRNAQAGTNIYSGRLPTTFNQTPIRVARAVASLRSRTAPPSAAPPRASARPGTDK